MASPEVTTIGKYEIQAELGHGGFGIVYKAFDPQVGRPVAIKVLTVEGNRDVLTRFRNEATSAGNLRHRNIVTVHDYGEFNGRPYLVMELLEGRNLADIIAEGANLSLLQKMTIMDQVADGLDCAHRNGVVHRDVKPANIQILPDGTVKIMDFGIARVNRDREATRLTQQGDLVGTILYMSPEQFSGTDADALCDIFAYGVTYFELLTGKHPFRSADPRAVMFKITVEDPPSVRSMSPDCPEGLEQILNRALQKDRELRYHSLRDVQLDAEPLILELKQAKAVTLVVEAHQLSDADDAKNAIAIINEALDLDPGNRDARRLREVIQRQLQKEALQPRITAMLQTAEEQLAKGSYTMAVQTLESALRLDPADTGIQGALDRAREKLQRSKEAARAAMAAVAEMGRGEWASAQAKAREAIAIDPANRDAARVLQALGKHINSTLDLVNRQIERREIDAALVRLKELEALDPSSENVRKMIGVAEALKEERDRIQGILENVHRLLAESRFEEALNVIGSASLPDEQAIRELKKLAEDGLAARRRREAIEKAASTVETLLEASKLDEALAQIDDAVRSYPNETRLGEVRAKALAAKSARERDKLRQSVSDNVERFLAENRFAEAMELVQTGLRAYADEPLFLELRRKVQQQAEKLKREEAIREGIRKAITEAQDRANRQNFDEALAVLEEPIKSSPADSQLIEARRAILDQRAKWERQMAVGEIKRQSHKLAQDKSFAQALAIIEAGLQKYADEPVLIELQRNAQEQLALQKRAGAIESRIAESRKLLQDGEPQQALDALEKAVTQYPGEERLTQLLAEARQQLLVQQHRVRQAAIQRGIDKAQALLAQHNTQAAIESLEKSAGQFPKEERFAKLLTQAREQLVTEKRQAAILAVITQASALQNDQKFDDAIQVLEKGLKSWPNENELTKLLKTVRQAQADFERQEREQRAAAIRQQMDSAQKLLAEHKTKLAIEALEQALQQFPAEKSIQEFLAQAQAQLVSEQRQVAVDQVSREAQALEKKTDLEGAIRVLEGGLKSWPDEPQLKEHLDRTRKRLQQHKDAIRQRVKASRALLDQGRLEQAVEAARAACKEYPQEPETEKLLKDAQAQFLKWQREQEIEQVRKQAEAALAENKPDVAAALIENRFAEAPELSRLLALAREQEQHRRARKEALASLLEIERQIGANPKKKKLKQLGEQAQQVGASYISDAEFSVVLDRIRARAIPAEPIPERKPIPRTWIAGGLAAIALIAAGVFFTSRKPPPKPQLIALQVSTDPPGASVRIGDRSCTTPDCRIELTPGNYQVQAELKGYKPVERSVVLEASKPASPVALTLEPLPPPPAAPATTATVTPATLLVETGVADALVFIDDAPRQRTDDKGTLRLDLDPKSYRVRVQKNDYQVSPEQQTAKLKPGSTRTLAFKLTPAVAKKEPSAQPITQPVITPPVNPPAPPDVKTAPTEPTEDQEWDRVKNVTDPAQIQRFIDKYPNGTHRPQAQRLQDDLAWSRVDKNDVQALTAFRDQNPNSAHKPEAQTRIDQLNQQAQAAAETVRRAQQQQQQQVLLQSERQEISGVLDNLSSLMARKRWGEVKKIWSGVSTALEQTRDNVSLNRKGDPVIAGDSATVACELVIQYSVVRRPPQVIAEKVTLQKKDGHWIVANVTPSNQ